MITRRNLQISMAVLACVPVLTGLIGMLGIYDPIYHDLPIDPTLDSNLRFYAGVWCGLGLAGFWLLPRIEHQTTLFRAIWLAIFIGGLGRLLSLISVGMPFPPFVGFIALELVGAPLIVWWQAKIAREAANGRGQN